MKFFNLILLLGISFFSISASAQFAPDSTTEEMGIETEGQETTGECDIKACKI